MSKLFYYDYFSLNETNVEEWHKEFFWPVSWSSTQSINEDFRNFHVDMINRLGDSFEGDCLLIAYHISGKFIDVLNHYLAVKRLKDNGYHVCPSPFLKMVPFFQAGSDFSLSHDILFSERKNLKMYARNLKSSIKFNLSRGESNFLRQFYPRTVASAGVTSHELVHSSHEWVKLITSGWLLDDKIIHNAPLKPNSLAVFEQIVTDFIDFATQYMTIHYDLVLPQNIINALKTFATDYITKTSSVYSVLLRSIEKFSLKTCLTTTAGNPYTRALSLAAMRNGVETIGFPHGYFICHHSGSRLAFHEFATVKNFVAYTQGSIDLYLRNIKLNVSLRGNKPKILCDNTSYFTDLRNKWLSKPIHNKVKNVMVLELSLIPEWAGYYAAEAMINYHFYFSICKFLSEHRYNVYFKKRPKSLSFGSFNIFNSIPNVKVLTDNFEQDGIIDMCDAVIMQYGCSSTLNFSICTNKRVIYVDSGWEPWFPDVYLNMSKRCGILHCHYDDSNRPVFDKSELLHLLENDLEPINMEYFEKYLSFSQSTQG